MRATNRQRLQFLTLAAGLLLPLPLSLTTVRAEDPSIAPPRFEVCIRTDRPTFNPPTKRAYVTAGIHKFVFILPDGYQVITEGAEEKIKLLSPGHDCQITFSILSPMPPDTKDLAADNYRDLVQSRHPEGKIVEEFSRGADEGYGPGFDMKWKTASGFPQCTRTVYLPSQAGVLELSATAGPDKFGAVQNELNGILGSIIMSKNGKIEVPPLSDKI